jgi:hypothetical protein
MFTLDFFTDNSAFEDNRTGEIARILRQLADVVESEGDSFEGIALLDVNGNHVGKANFEPDDD